MEGYYEWDDDKRRSNIGKHGLDFIDVPMIIEGDHVLGRGTTVNGESREIATGRIDGRYATVVFTRRNSAIRVISLRSARHGEREKHQQAFGC